MSFESLEDIVRMSLEAMRPPERLTVAEAAVKYRRLNNRGAYVGPWKHETTPYLVEPMEELTNPDFRGEVYVGSSQSGKTDMGLNYIGYTVKCDPVDFMLIEASQQRANDFSKRRVSRMHRDSPEFGRQLLPGPQYDGIHDKRYTSGVMLRISWPSINELSGRPIPRVFLTDYDRMPLDVDGEGSAYDLARARTTTFGRNGMTVAESSPSYPVLDPNWSPKTPHEAPPCEGIISLYNRGDRRRWYWVCVVCRNAFEPNFSLLVWDPNSDAMKAAETVRMKCPHCDAMYRHEATETLPGKFEMNVNGFWMKDGQKWDPSKGEVVGEAVQSDIASFWLKGVASAFQSWKQIVVDWLRAEEEYLATGSETALQTTVNTAQAEPYTPKSEISSRVAEKLQERSFDFGYKTVPNQVTYLVAAIDVQQFRFVVQVTGISPGGDYWIIDRFDIKHSLRPDMEKEGQFHRIRPFTYREDWRTLVREVVLKTYPLGDESGRHMAIKAVICDSGGMDQGTSNAYEFWRWLKHGPKQDDPDQEKWEEVWVPGLHARFQLFKGESVFSAPRVKMTYPDSGRQSKFAEARGEIPVLRCNVTTLKNKLDGMLDRVDVRSGRINFARWLPLNFYKELCVEVKSIKGIWENPRNFRNESWDLLVMTIAINLERRHVGIETIDWDKPPPWASFWDDNPMVFVPDVDESPLAGKPKGQYSLEQLGRLLG